MRFVLKGVLPLNRAQALRDVIAGATLAAMSVPQVLGYARIAGMPPVAGLYTVLWPTVAFAVFGASRHLVVAADSATATILASRLSAMAPVGSAHYVALAGMAALLTAGLLVLARIFKLGFLADFLSRTVLAGFLAGVGVQVAIAMTGDMIGLREQAHGTLAQIWQIVRSFDKVHVPTLAISATVVVGIFALKYTVPRLPGALLAVLLGIAASYGFDFAGRGISTLGPVHGGLPDLQLPWVSWQDIVALLPVAGACFTMIIAQSAAAGRAFAERYHERIDADADILGLAAANAAAAASGTFVVNGSPTQTAAADAAGARSQLAQLVFAAIVVCVLLFLSDWLQYLPHGILSALVFTIAIGLIDLKSLRAILRESPGEFGLAFTTAAAVVLIGVEQGIVLAIILSLLRHVRHSYRPHTILLIQGRDTRWVPAPATPGRETAPGLLVYRFGADLFYANDHFFVAEVNALIDSAPHKVRKLVIDASAITNIDYSASRSVDDLCANLLRNGVDVIFGRVSSYLRADMERHGLVAILGDKRIFPTLHEALTAAGVEAPLEVGPKT